MKTYSVNQKYISLNWLSKIDLPFLSLCLFLFTIPLSSNIARCLLAIWCFSSTLANYKLFGNTFKKFRDYPIVILLLIFFFVHVLSLFISENIEYALKDLEIKIGIVLFPFLILVNRESYSYDKTKNIFNFFILGNLIAVFICFTRAFYYSITFYNSKFIFNPFYYEGVYQSLGNHFYYYDFSFLMHPTYFSVFILYSICLLYFFYIRKQNKTNLSYWISISAILFFMVSLYFVSSRAGILSILFLMIFYIYTLIRKKLNIILKVMGILILSSVFLILILINNRFDIIFKEIKESELDGNSKGSIALRIYTWRSAISVISENPILGVGIGDSKQILMLDYKKNNYIMPYERRLNAHNQYLETTIGTGLVGLIFLIIIIIYAFIDAFRRNNFLQMLIVFIISFNFLWESMLERFWGVVAFAFFISFFNINNYKFDINHNQ